MAEVRGGNFGASWVASGDLSAAQWRLVGFSGNNVFLPTSGVQCAGVLMNKPKDNEHASVINPGYAKLILAGSLAQGAEFMTGNNGFATLAASGQWAHGWLVSAGNSGEIVEAIVGPGYRKTV